MDQLLAGLRKYGFSFITALLAADSILGQPTAQASITISPLVKLAVMIVTLVLVCALYATDRYYRIIQHAASQAAMRFEGKTGVKYGLTKIISESYEKKRAWVFIELIYALFGLATGILGTLVLWSSFQPPNSPNQSVEVMIGATVLAVLFIVLISDRTKRRFKYFAYGSDMDPKQMRERGISPTAIYSRKRGTLMDFKLEFNKRASQGSNAGYANIVPSEGEKVEGVLYTRINELDMDKLDQYNGYPDQYTREELIVLQEDIPGQDAKHNRVLHSLSRSLVKLQRQPIPGVKATVYIANPSHVEERGLTPPKKHLDHLLAAPANVLTTSYVEHLKSLGTTTKS